MSLTVPAAECRTYDTPTAARILGVSPGLLYKIARLGPTKRPEYKRYGCNRIAGRVTWAQASVDAAAPQLGQEVAA